MAVINNNKISVKNKIENEQGIKVAYFKKSIRNTSPHIHKSYFEIIYLSSGSGFHFIDEKRYPINTPVIFFIKKDQVHHWNILSEPDGFVLILKKSYLENLSDKDIKNLLSELSAYECAYLENDTNLNNIFRLFESEYSEMNNNAIVIEALLKASLAKLVSLIPAQQIKNKRPQGLYLKFENLLEHKLVNSVSYYAERINTTPQNLNNICQKSKGVSASQIISAAILNEAKRLLLYTDNTVSEISHILNFKDCSHFVKYFKRYTGDTPAAFRNK